MGFHSYMVPIVGLLSQRTLQGTSTRSLESSHDFLLHTIPRHRGRSKITTSGWRCTFRCSVHISRMIGRICSRRRSLPTIITTIRRSTQPPFLRIMDITQPLRTCQAPDSLASLTNGSGGFMKHRRNANARLNSLRKFRNEHTISGKTTTLALKSEIQCGLKQPISQLMNPLQSS